jgi:histidyl-tRNA synthetase
VFKKPRGTRDFTFEEMQKRRYIENIMRSTFQKYGYREIQTPTFENLELFTAKSGDTIIEELYSFTDKGGRNLALRPELTAPVIRFYVDKLKMEPKPLKMFYFGNCYRYDRPQKGRYREFKQAGCEIIGTDSPEAYAELIAMAFNILKISGLKNIELRVGNLDILTSIFNKYKLTKDQQKYIIPLIDKSLFEELYESLIDFKLDIKDASYLTDLIQSSNIEDIDKLIEDKKIKEELKYFKEILGYLSESFDIKNFKIDFTIVRGLDYYKGIVFEIDAPTLGAEKQLCGGGSYDLIPLFGGNITPTAGFAIGFDRTILALEKENYNFILQTLDYFVIPINEDMIKKSLEIVKLLREKGLLVDIDLLRRGIGKSLKYASSIKAKKVIIVGPDELELNSVTIKDMDSGNQETVKIDKLK